MFLFVKFSGADYNCIPVVIIVCVRINGFSWARIIDNSTSEEIASHLYDLCLTLALVPNTVQSDNGKQFVGHVVRYVYKLHLTTAMMQNAEYSFNGKKGRLVLFCVLAMPPADFFSYICFNLFVFIMP